MSSTMSRATLFLLPRLIYIRFHLEGKACFRPSLSIVYTYTMVLDIVSMSSPSAKVFSSTSLVIYLRKNIVIISYLLFQ